MASPPQFGQPLPGRLYPDRPVAFGVALKDGLVALARVEPAGAQMRIDLPGGGLDPGEGPEDALRREFAEETGLMVRPTRLIARADHYFTNGAGEAFNTRGRFFEAEVTGLAPELKIEADHALFWAAPEAALRLVSRESHAWALACWLRLAQASGARD